MLGVLRQIALLLSLMVMMGHDVVPHTHDIDEAIEAGHELHHLNENSLSGLRHAFSHYQHHSIEKAAELSVKAVKKADVLKNMVAVIDINTVNDGIISYSNLKKQKFWGQRFFAASLIDTSQTLRGPPSC